MISGSDHNNQIMTNGFTEKAKVPGYDNNPSGYSIGNPLNYLPHSYAPISMEPSIIRSWP